MTRTLTALVLVLTAAPAWASSITIVSSTAGAGWQSVGTVRQNGARYWDNPSWDSGACNVGHVLTGTQTCGPTIPGGGISPANLEWWGLANGDADPNFLFALLLTGARLHGTDLFTATGLATVDDLGWYDPGSSLRRSLFNALSHIGDAIDEAPPLLFGLYLNNGSGDFKTGITSADRQRFAVFRNTITGTLYIAAEDLPNGITTTSDYDYNDRIISIQSADSVPEPSTLMLLTVALFVSVLCIRRHGVSR